MMSPRSQAVRYACLQSDMGVAITLLNLFSYVGGFRGSCTLLSCKRKAEALRLMSKLAPF